MSTQTIDYTKILKIKNKRSDKPIRSRDGKTGDGTTIVQNSGDGEARRFLFMPVDMEKTKSSSWYYVFQEKSGRVIQPESGSENNGKKLKIKDFTGADCQKVRKNYSSSKNDEYTFGLQFYHSGLYFGVADDSKDEDAIVKQKKWKDEGSKRWYLVDKGDIDMPACAESNETDPTPPEISNFNENEIPLESDVKLYGESLTPFYMVKDPNRTIAEQISETPYYKLRREQYYQRIGMFEAEGKQNSTYQYTVSAGVEESVQQSITETTGISITVDAGFSYGAVSASVSATYAKELSVTNSTGKSESKETTHSITVDFPVGEHTLAAFWQLVDHYVLMDSKGQVVLVWDVPWDSWTTTSYTENIETGETIEPSYTEKVVSKEQAAGQG